MEHKTEQLFNELSKNTNFASWEDIQKLGLTDKCPIFHIYSWSMIKKKLE